MEKEVGIMLSLGYSDHIKKCPSKCSQKVAPTVQTMFCNVSFIV